MDLKAMELDILKGLVFFPPGASTDFRKMKKNHDIVCINRYILNQKENLGFFYVFF